MTSQTVGPSGLSRTQILIALWGAGGVTALFCRAIWRMTPFAFEPFEIGLSGGQAALYAGWVIFSLYTEGYRAFHQRFSPRVVARALHLAQNPRFTHVLFAPAYCMSLFHATRRAQIISWLTVVMVVCFIVILRHTPQPWRGIVDGGVVAALVSGALSMVYFLMRGLGGRKIAVDSDLPP
jgi:hypothetical protein